MTIKTSRLILAACGISAFLGACDILDVSNPNALVQEDIEKVAAAAAAVNGAQALTASGIGRIYAPFSAVGDEITWIGSRDAWNELDQGTPDNSFNEFADGAFPGIAQARWMTNFAVELMEAHVSGNAGDATLQGHLARANLYAGVAYSTIAQMFDDFAFSDRTEPGPLIGPANMASVFDEAIAFYTAAMAGGGETAMRAQAGRAQAYHQRAIWGVLNPPGSTPSNPLVNDANATSDAAAVLGSVAGSDWAYRFQYSGSTVGNNLSWQVNERGELQIGPEYATQSESDPTDLVSHNLMDPIEGALDTRYEKRVNEFLGGEGYAPLTVVGERGLRLILAEAALASGNMAGFTEHVNMIREGLDGLTAYSGQIPGIEMLQHERRVNLFLQYKRLQDHYRFGVSSMNWLASSPALITPGTMLPITSIEIRANCHHPRNDNHPCAG